MRAATDALHSAGMEAILDVVFNHNGESDQFGPTLVVPRSRQRRLVPARSQRPGDLCQRRRHRQLSRARPAARRRHGDRRAEAMDDLRRDRRLPLRSRHCAWPRAGRFRSRRSVLSGRSPKTRSCVEARLIAEPWDVGPGGYQLGAFGPGFAEWNDRFRDAARRFWRGDNGLRGEIATRMAGSRDVFSRARRRRRRASTTSSRTTASRSPTSSLTRKSTTRRTASTTATEPTPITPGITASRGRRRIPPSSPRGRVDQRNLLTLLFASRGTPMLAMGAELGFSQGGNNNAYAQDNPTTAIDWADADAALIAFARRLAEIRRAHPALSRDAFLTGEPFDSTRIARRRMAGRRRSDDAPRPGTTRRARCSSRSSPRRTARASIASRSR